MKLWIKTHRIIKWLFPRYVWDFSTAQREVWLTFDDGPIPEVTPWVLEQLKAYDAKATFFCIGDNVRKHPDVLEQVLADGHTVGNHTFNHWNGWKTDTSHYVENVARCADEIGKHLKKPTIMRPPYGKITRKQAGILRKSGYSIIMWDIVSADFDASVSPEQCMKNVVENVEPGSIIVFHDSVKAFRNLQTALPETLKFLAENGYRCVVPERI